MSVSPHRFPTLPASNSFGADEDDDRSSTVSTNSRDQHPLHPDDTDLTSEGKSSQSKTKDVSGSTLPRSSSSKFDPKTLLSPKSAKPLDNEKKSPSPDKRNGSVVFDDDSASGVGSMIENLHRLERRENTPRKRRKVEQNDNEEEKEEEENKKRPTGAIEGSGILGDYITEERKKIIDTAKPTTVADVVDLTADDDDVVITGATGAPVADKSAYREVCMGKIDGATAYADLIPTPRSNALQPTATTWPPMKVRFRREPSNNVMIHLQDPTYRDFAKLDFKTSEALAPLLDAAASNKMRVKASLESRKRIAGEQAGSPTSRPLNLQILLYAPLAHVRALGHHLAKKQIYLRDTSATGIGIELVNPHNPKATAITPPQSSTHGSSSSSTFTLGSGYVSRTAEEIRSDVLNMFDSITKSEDLPEMDQDPRITTELLSHQKQALYFMSEREKDRSLPSTGEEGKDFHLWVSKHKASGQKIYYNVITGHESSARPPPVLGGILADMMGLGKTLSILSLVVGSLDEAAKFSALMPPRTAQLPLMRNSKATLLVCPLSTVANWEDQIKTHIKAGEISYYIYHGSNRTQDVNALAKYDLIITSYHTLASEIKRSGTKRPMYLTHWFRVVLDEAHQARTQSTGLSLAVCELAAERRWAVTGTPVQNRLDDLGALIKFLRIKPFDEKGAFAQFILAPFKNADPEILPKLRLLVDSITLRRLKDRINLPSRTDLVVRLDWTPAEKQLYDLFLADSQKKVRAMQGAAKMGGRSYAHVLKTIMRLRLICAHGEELLSEDDRKLTEGLTYNSAIDISDEEEADRPALTQKQAFEMLYLLRESDMDRCGICQKKIAQREMDDDDLEISPNTNTIGHMTPCYQIVCPSCFPIFLDDVTQVVGEDNFMSCPLCRQWVRAVFFELKQSELDEDEQAKARVRANPKLAKQLGFYRGPHTKTKALMESLRAFEAWSIANPEEEPIKSVVFSSWTSHLDLIQIGLEANNFKYTRLDGSMGRKQRATALDVFRDDPSICVILVSIGAGGLGLNLTTASKVFMMEPQFNPAAEAQAVDRVHRLGQRREVTINRFIMRGSFEERMLELQQKKKDLADLSLNRNVKLDRAEANKRKLEELQTLFRR